jgi:hypothetical protein
LEKLIRRGNFRRFCVVCLLSKEDAMLREKNTLPLWRSRRPNFLSLERALAPPAGDACDAKAERVVIGRKAELRRFNEAKGKIHPPALRETER